VTGARKVDAGNRAAHSPVPSAKAAMSGSLSLYGEECDSAFTASDRLPNLVPNAEYYTRVIHVATRACGRPANTASCQAPRYRRSWARHVQTCISSALLPLRHKGIKSRTGTPRRALDCERRGSPCRPGARRSWAGLAFPRGPRPLRRQPR
jgi:hypothetical protein